MTEKRYTYLDASRNKYIGSFFCNGKPLTNDEVVGLLREQNRAIKLLQEDNKRLKEYINRIEYSYQREYGMSLRNAEWLE